VNHGAGRELTGFKRAYRLEKRQEAEERNALTLPERRRSYARSLGVSRLSQYKPIVAENAKISIDPCKTTGIAITK